MRIKHLFAGFFLLLLTLAAAAQRNYTLEDIFRNPDLYADGYSDLQWIPATEKFTYLDGNALMTGNCSKEEDRILVSIDKLNTAIRLAQGESLKRFPVVNWTDEDNFLFFSSGDLFLYTVSSGNIKKINSCGEDAENKDIATKTMHVAYTIDNNLYVAFNSKTIQLSREPDTGVVTGKTVHRNEWGIGKGTFWSPEGNLLAFYRMDESMVTNYPLVDISKTPAVVEYTRYPMAGMTSHRVTVGVFNPATGKTTFLKTGDPPDQFLTNITWTPDEKYILIAVLNRAQDHMWLNLYDAGSGEFVKTLFEETDEQYVEPQHGPVFLNKTPDQFIWQSKRDGYNRLYLYDLGGQMIRQLTKGSWEVTELYGISDDDKMIWLQGNLESPVCRDIYSVETASGKLRRLSEDAGWHNARLSSNKKKYIDDFSSVDIASRVIVYTAEGRQTKILINDENPLRNYKYGKTKIFSIKSELLGDDLYCRMILPPDFDSTRRYPVVIYVYGGPHSQLVTNTWLGGSGLFLNYLATQGYIVFTMDNHGTNGRGQDFEQVIHRQVGKQEVKDQMAGVAYLKGLPYVDRNRIAVHGWSYGGFLTISMLVHHPDDFKVGVCGGPVCNWKYYEVMYGERYMDTPEENATGYEQSAVTNFADQLQAKLLILHGSMDPTVVQQNSLDFLQQCVSKGILLDYFVYPGHEHNVRGIDRLHMYRKIEEYIKENL